MESSFGLGLPSVARLVRPVMALLTVLVMAGCVYQPLHGGAGYADTDLSQIYVEEVSERTGQLVRNHLVFLLQRGQDNPAARYRLRMRTNGVDKTFAAIKGLTGDSAGSYTVTVSYELFDSEQRTMIASGTRSAFASYDRTAQSFANNRASLDARKRAAVEVAELLRLALSADLRS